jgi:hypothetical protein
MAKTSLLGSHVTHVALAGGRLKEILDGPMKRPSHRCSPEISLFRISERKPDPLPSETLGLKEPPDRLLKRTER